MMNLLLKKTVLGITFLFLISSFSFSQTPEEKERKQFKKTKVISETLMGYEPDEHGKASDIGVKKSTRTINSNGDITSIIEYDKNSQPTKRTVIKYNSKKQKMGVLVYKGFDELIDKYKFYYNAQGLKTSKKGIFPGNEYLITYSYDKQQNLIKKVKKKGDLTVYTYRYTFNNGLLTKEDYTSEKFSLTKTFEYDSVGHIIKEDNQTSNFQGYKFEFEYDSLGNQIKETKYSVDGLPYESFQYSYDSKKNITKIVRRNLDNVAIFKWSYGYDGKGNLEVVKLYDLDMTKPIYITKYLYKYYKKK